MATAGRILIMPKGPYDASVTYEMLDMVSHEGATWLAKKTSVGIAPSDSVSDYWFKMVGINEADMEAFKEEILEEVSGMLSAAATISEEEGNEQYNDLNTKYTNLNAKFANYLPLAGGTMTGALTAKNPDVGTAGVRNIKAGTADLTAGVSALENGAIYIVYE